MRGTTRTVAVAALSAVALLAAGCGSGDSDDTATSAAGAKTGGEITVRGCNPQNPLVPSNTTETCGGNVIDAVFAKLVHYDAETAKPTNDIAESIETTDNQNFTVKLKQGYKFHDGTEVTSKSFVDAWNYAAYGPNAQSSGYFMEPIEGFADLQCAGTTNPDDPCEGFTPKAKEMTGLKVVDDHTFTIKTTEKVSNLPVRLGYSAFSPLPDVVLRGPQGLRRQADRHRPVQARLVDQGAGDRPVEVRRLHGRLRWQRRQGHLQDLPGPRRRLQRRPRQQPRRHRRDPGERADRRQVQVGPARPQRAEGVWCHPDDHRGAEQGRPELRRPADQAGDLDGDRPRDHHQADLQRHPRPRHRLGLPGRRRLQGRRSAVSSASTTRPRPRPCSRRPAASRATRSPSPTTRTPRTRSGPRPPATASSRPWASSARPSGSSTSRPSAARSRTAR